MDRRHARPIGKWDEWLCRCAQPGAASYDFTVVCEEQVQRWQSS